MAMSGDILLASSRERSRMVLTILPCRGQTHNKNHPAQNIKSTKVKKPYSRGKVIYKENNALNGRKEAEQREAGWKTVQVLLQGKVHVLTDFQSFQGCVLKFRGGLTAL